jgi:hypothetical protein
MHLEEFGKLLICSSIPGLKNQELQKTQKTADHMSTLNWPDDLSVWFAGKWK